MLPFILLINESVSVPNLKNLLFHNFPIGFTLGNMYIYILHAQLQALLCCSVCNVHGYVYLTGLAINFNMSGKGNRWGGKDIFDFKLWSIFSLILHSLLRQWPVLVLNSHLLLDDPLAKQTKLKREFYLKIAKVWTSWAISIQCGIQFLPAILPKLMFVMVINYF